MSLGPLRNQIRSRMQEGRSILDSTGLIGPVANRLPPGTQPPAGYEPPGLVDRYVALFGGNKYVAGGVALGAGYLAYKKFFR